jgi:hypothetical protein
MLHNSRTAIFMLSLVPPELVSMEALAGLVGESHRVLNYKQ